MKKVTKNNLLRLVNLKKKYLKSQDKEILNKINYFIINVINKDKKYYSKLKSYNFDDETLKYLM